MSYRYSEEQLRSAGEALWATRWENLTYMETVDGAVSISDVTLWIKWLFWLPGDYVVIALMTWAPSVAVFLEAGPGSLTGWLSSTLSAFAWLFMFAMTSSLDP